MPSKDVSQSQGVGVGVLGDRVESQWDYPFVVSLAYQSLNGDIFTKARIPRDTFS